MRISAKSLAILLLGALLGLGGCSRPRAQTRDEPTGLRVETTRLFGQPDRWFVTAPSGAALTQVVRERLRGETVMIEEPPIEADRWRAYVPPFELPGARVVTCRPRFATASDQRASIGPGDQTTWAAPLTGASLSHPTRPLKGAVGSVGFHPMAYHVTALGAYLLLPRDGNPDLTGFRLRYPAMTTSVLGALADLRRPPGQRPTPRRIALAKTSREAIVMPPPGSMERAITIPEHATSLQLAVALPRNSFHATDDGIADRPALGDGAGFAFHIATLDGTTRTIWSPFVEPEERGSWIEHTIDLSAYAGQPVRLQVHTHASKADRSPDARDDIALIAEPRFVRPAPERETPRGVVLCVIDTLRRDALPCYGNARIETPAIDRFAEESVLFANARSTSNWTLPAHASLFTSLHVTQHRTNKLESVMSEELTTLAEVFQDHGWATGAFTGGAFLSPRTGVAQGFDVFDHSHREFAPTVENALAWVKRQTGPFFLFLHTYEVHSPYDAPDEFRDRYVQPYSGWLPRQIDDQALLARSESTRPLSPTDVRYAHQLYEAGVAYMDQVFGEFVEELRTGEMLDETMIVFTSDHGEEFFEHGSFSHRTSLYDEQLAIPLLVRLPGGERAGTRAEHPAQLIDLAPTIMQVVDLPLPFEWSGVSLLSPSRERRAHLAGSIGRGKEMRYMVCTHPMKWIELPPLSSHAGGNVTPGQIFDLDRDPGERQNLWSADEARRYRALLDILKKRFPHASGSADITKSLSAEEIQILRKLGYL